MRKSILIGIAIALTAMVAVGCKSSPKETVYDVYVAGSEAHDPFWKTELWVNGKSASAPSADGGLKAVFVSGNDIYVAGSEVLEGGSSMSAALWKNGVAVPLTPSGRVSYAHSVFVSGSDVYVVGYAQQKDTGTWCATLWKNGKPKTLSDAPSGAYSVFVSGQDLYISGYEKDETTGNLHATLWRNDEVIKLKSSAKHTSANAVYVEGRDVYAVGYKMTSDAKMFAMLWRNGTRTKLSSSGAEKADALSVYVIDDNVYVVGTEKKGGKDVAMLWKKVKGSDSWISEELTDGKESAEAASVFVVKRNK